MTVTTNQVLAGVGLILVLAVGSQVLASRLRIPALIVLLPAGFVAGAVTTDVNPQRLLFLVRADGKLMPVTKAGVPVPQPEDTMVLLEPALVGS